MNLPAPENAPRRNDIAFLRRRSRPKSTSAAAPPAASQALADFFASRGGRPNRAANTPAQQASTATPSGELDLSSPAPTLRPPTVSSTATPAAGAAPGRTLRDLPAPSRSPATSSLDLTDPAPPKSKTRPAPSRVRAVARARPGTHTILTPKAPTVTLTRLQTGVGTLTFTAVCSGAVGDLRLGCAYQLRSGDTSTLPRADGSRIARRNSTCPVIVGQRDPYERISVDLRQCQEIQRLIIYGYSESGTELRWGGALVVTTFGDAKIELPLDASPSTGVGVFLSLYNVRGEFVLRSEMDMVTGSVRDACRAYGFDRITWIDEKTPLG
jgi:hypothetical protein